MRVLCIRSRMIADDRYKAGEVYTISKARESYIDLGYFEPIAEQPKVAARAKRKAKAKAETGNIDKPGLVTESGKTINLDGTPTE